MRKLAGISSLLAIFAACSFAQSSHTAAELLRNVAASYSSATSYYFEATETTRTHTAELDRVRERKLVTAGDSLQRWRIEIEDSVLHTIAVFDGRLTTTYQPVSGQYMEEVGAPAASASIGAANLRNYFTSRYSTMAERLQTARMLGDEPREVEGQNVLCKVIEAEYAAPPGAAVASLRRTFWIDPAQSTVLREKSEAQMTSPGGERIVLEQTISFRAATLASTLPEHLFAFHPPPGARQTESFEKGPVEGAALTGNPAPAFSLTSIAGKSYSLESLRGRVVLLNFWATWCVPCRLEMPLLEELHRNGADNGLVVLGINNEAPEIALRFLEGQGYTFPTLADENNAAARAYAVESIPTTFGIDKTGKVAFQHAGAQSKDELVEALAAAGFQAPR
jgi:thiol-disulfide isomerase/thioredoxin